MKPRAIVFHELRHILAATAAAREAGQTIELWSAPEAAAYAGIGWLDAIIRRVRAAPGGKMLPIVVDCGDRPELALAALRQGIRDVCFRGDKATARRLTDIARQGGTHLRTRRPAAALDLRHSADPLKACRDWLAAATRAH
jgi:hypothetical protein